MSTEHRFKMAFQKSLSVDTLGQCMPNQFKASLDSLFPILNKKCFFKHLLVISLSLFINNAL